MTSYNYIDFKVLGKVWLSFCWTPQSFTQIDASAYSMVLA